MQESNGSSECVSIDSGLVKGAKGSTMPEILEKMREFQVLNVLISNIFVLASIGLNKSPYYDTIVDVL